MKARYFAGLLALAIAYFGGSRQADAAATILPPGETCFAALTPTSGGIAGTGTGLVGLLGTITPGTGGAAGVYGGVTLTGSLSGQASATANVTVSGGGVTAVAILNPGSQYVAGDVLTASSAAIGNVSGFSVPVSSVAINQSLAGGSVGYYIPSTNTFKQTWQNAGQTILNANPVTLDANGCATVYGTGIYRQILKDSLGNTIWDVLTTDVSANNNTFWAGQAGGTANAITVTDAGFNATDGSIINFFPLLTNTGATTLNPSSFGNVPVVKDTSGGPVALAGGEIVVSGLQNVVSVVYSAAQGNFHLLNTVIATQTGVQSPLCGASGLTVTNGGSASTQINVTANSVILTNAVGLSIKRGAISLTLTTTSGNVTSTPNGMDGESPGTSAWVDVFAIDNGTVTASLGSAAAGNGQSPALPTGYTYQCYLGAMRVDSSGNLLRTIQRGPRAGYVVTATTNTAALPSIISGIQGNVNTPTWVAAAISAYVPPTAAEIHTVFSNVSIAGTGTVAPNNGYGASNSASNPPPCAFAFENPTNAGISNMTCTFLLETTNLYYAANSGGVALFAKGWTDAVNAN